MTVVLVTGAGRGIGRAIAARFAAGGADVAVTDVAIPIEGVESTATPDDLEETARLVRDTGRSCLALTADVRSQDSLDAAVARAAEELGPIDVVVANAGFGHSKPFWEYSDADWQLTVDINLSGAWRTAKAVAPVMIERRLGVILFVASSLAAEATWDLAAYVAAKHGVIGLMRSVALDMAPHGVRANAVLPAQVATPATLGPDELRRLTGSADASFDDYQAAVRRLLALGEEVPLPAEAIADALVWLASNEARLITGAALPVDGGRLALPGYNRRAPQ